MRHEHTEPGQATGAERAFCLAMTVLAIAAAGFVFATHVLDQVDWRRHYELDSIQRLAADACGVALAPWTGSYDDLRRQPPPAFTPQKVPMRGAPAMPIPAADQILITRCDLELPASQRGRDLILSLGPSFGTSRLYVNGARRLDLSGSSDAELTISAEESVTGRLRLELYSRPAGSPVAGLASMIPPYVTADPAAHQQIQQFRLAIKHEQPAFRIALSLGVVLLMLGLVASGLSYRDMHWMGILAASFAVHDGLVFLAASAANPELLTRGQGAANFVMAFSLIAFHYAQTNRRQRSLAPVAVILLAIAASSALCFAVSPEFFQRARLLTRVQALVALGGLSVLGAVGFGRSLGLGSGPQRARLQVYSCLALATAAAFGLEAWLEDVNALFVRPIVQVVLLGAYSAAMVRDLVARQGLYFRERSLRVRRDQELVEARAVAETARLLAHDVRRPYHMIRIFTRRCAELQQPADVRAFNERYLPMILKAQADVDSLLDDVISAYKPESGASEDCPADELIGEALRQAIAARPVARISLKYEIDEVVCHGAPRQLTRALANLLENAADAVGVSGSITVKAALAAADEAAPAVRLTIHNTGSFVPPELREKIFELGYSTGKARGTGLGLAIVKRTVEGLGGTVACESSQATGTMFVLRLPGGRRDDVQPRRDLPTRWHASCDDLGGSPLPPSEGAIIVVEDDDLQRLEWEMARGKDAIQTYARPEELLEALEQASDVRIRCFILDENYVDSELKGSDVAPLLKERFPNALVVLATNSPRGELASLRGVDHVTRKDVAEVVTLLEAG